MIEVHHLRIIILCYLEIVCYSFGAVLVQFQISKFSRITKFIKITKLHSNYYIFKTNFDEITNLTGPTKFSSLAASGQGISVPQFGGSDSQQGAFCCLVAYHGWRHALLSSFLPSPCVPTGTASSIKAPSPSGWISLASFLTQPDSKKGSELATFSHIRFRGRGIFCLLPLSLLIQTMLMCLLCLTATRACKQRFPSGPILL